MAADLGISRDTLMAHYMSNHIAVAYGDIFDEMVALSRDARVPRSRAGGERVLNVPDRFYLGIDVGTGSARAGLFDGAGAMLGRRGSPDPDVARRPGTSSSSRPPTSGARAARPRARRCATRRSQPERVRGIGFDATCSLVALDAADRPVTVSPTGDDQRNVVVWMDHRAIDQARAHQSPPGIACCATSAA